jgi:hypothetical protein
VSITEQARTAQAHEEELAELRRALATAQRRADKRQRHVDELVEAVYRAAREAMLAHGPAVKIVAPKLASKGKPEAALLHLTDWQLGKHTSSFNMDVCRSRITQAVNACASLTDIQRSHHPVTECHVMLGGDMVEGVGIFPGQAFEVEAAAFEQLVAVAKLIESVVASLLSSFDKVHVWEEIGNHGRLGRKGDHPHGDNIDRMAYHLARTAITNPRLTWHPFGGGLGTHVNVGNYTALLVHGDEIKSFGGNTPAFGILRKCNAWATGVVAPFNDAYLGHFHTPMTLTMANAGRIFVTGSPESDNEYAKEFVAAVGKPSQRLHFVDPNKGRVTAEYLLWLD